MVAFIAASVVVMVARYVLPPEPRLEVVPERSWNIGVLESDSRGVEVPPTEDAVASILDEFLDEAGDAPAPVEASRELRFPEDAKASSTVRRSPHE